MADQAKNAKDNAKKGKGKNKKKLDAEKKAEEERQRLLKEEEERKKAEEEEKQRLEEERRQKEEADKKAEEDRLKAIEEEKAKLAEKIVVVPDNEEEIEEEKNKEKPEDKLYDYNGKRIKDKAFEMGFDALNKFTAEKEMADYIKNEFDNLFEPDWQVVVGKDFSVAFSFEIENFVFFQIEDIYFLLYKL